MMHTTVIRDTILQSSSIDMSNITPPLLNNDPFSKWGNSVRDAIHQTQIVRSTDVDISSSPFGTFIGLHNEEKYPTPHPIYKGEWNPMTSYEVNDVVRVLPGKSYDLNWDGAVDHLGIDPTFKVPLIHGKIAGVDIILYDYKPVAGTYICTAPIPDFNYTIQTLRAFGYSDGVIGVTAGVSAVNKSLSTYDQFVQDNINYLRFTNINYYPYWPEMPNQAVLDVYDVPKLVGRYWDLISLLPTNTYMCVDGSTTTAFSDSQLFPSGSANYTGSYSGNYIYTK